MTTRPVKRESSLLSYYILSLLGLRNKVLIRIRCFQTRLRVPRMNFQRPRCCRIMNKLRIEGCGCQVEQKRTYQDSKRCLNLLFSVDYGDLSASYNYFCI